MKCEWLQQTILRAASFVAPGDQRAEWLAGWRSELWYIPRRGSTLFCLGAFRDALWLRQNDVSPVQRPGMHLESPLSCLLFLGMLAMGSGLIAICLPAPHMMTQYAHLRGRDLLPASMVMLLYTCLLLPTTRLTMGRAPAANRPIPWPIRLRRGGFLTLKIALAQPIMLCGFVLLAAFGSLPIVPLAAIISWMLVFRWVLVDQRRRCPVCLRLLANPVRIGSPSQTFLGWYGAESMCSRGHGLLQVPEVSTSYSGRSRWLRLDGSWRSLFKQAAGTRQS